MNEQRIKLAEAMGWKREDHDFGQPTWVKDQVMCFAPDSQRTKDNELPDPFTDANDDYAVLEWMREKYGDHDWPSKMKPEWARFSSDVMAGAWYRIGDYARAALKLMDNGGD